MEEKQSGNYALSESRIDTLHEISKTLFGIYYLDGEKESTPLAVYRGGKLKPRSEALLLLGTDSLLGWNISLNDMSDYGYQKNLRKSIFAKMDELADTGMYDKTNKVLTESGLSELRLIIDMIYEHAEDLRNISPLITEEIMFLEENMENIPIKAKALRNDTDLSEKYKIVKRLFLDPADTSGLSRIGLDNMMTQFKEELKECGLISNGWVSLSSEDDTTPEIRNRIEQYMDASHTRSPAAQADSLVRGLRDYAQKLKRNNKNEHDGSNGILPALERFARKNAALIGAIYLKTPELKKQGENGNAKAHEPEMPRTEIRSYLAHINSTLEQMIYSEAIEPDPSRWDSKELEPLVWLYSGIDLPKDSEKKAFIRNARLFLLQENGDNEYAHAKSFVNLEFDKGQSQVIKKMDTEELAARYPEITRLDSIIKKGRQYSISFPLGELDKYGLVNRTDNNGTVAVDTQQNA